MANDINKEDPHYKGEYGSIYEVNRKFPTGGVAGDFVVIDGWAHYWNAVRGTWCVNAERDSYWDELITNIIEKFKLVRGATFMGVASLDTVPTKVIGAKMYYFATVAGTYKNFDNLVVPQGINVLYSENGSSWVNTTLLEVAQELGVSTNKVVSQKAVSDKLSDLSETFTDSLKANKVIKRLFLDFSNYTTQLGTDDVITIDIFYKYGDSIYSGIFVYVNNTRVSMYRNDTGVFNEEIKGVYLSAELNFNELENGTNWLGIKVLKKALSKNYDIRKSITTEKLADKVVTTEKLADKVVTTEKLADKVVTSKKIGDKESIGDVVANGFLVYGYIDLKGIINNNQTNLWVATPYLKIDTSCDILCHVEMNNNLIYPIAFYDKDKKFISGINNIEDSILRIQASEIPSNAVYLRASARENDKKRFVLFAPYYDEGTPEIADSSVTTEKLADKVVTKAKLADDIEVRKKMQILTSDSEVEILLKMKKAFDEGDYDVSFEYGEYTFSSIYTYMKETLKWSWTLGLPIGNNCRYYFNNSTLIANKPNEEYNDVMNVLDCKASPQNYELHDGVLINNGGTYCVHDEANASDKFYKHIYKNMRMTYNKNNSTDNISKCIGGGAGLKGYIQIENCVFKTDNTTECVSWHGANGKIPLQNLSFIISDCYFSNRLVIHGYTSSDVIFVKLCNNSFNTNPQIDNGVIEKISYNNEIRNN